MIEILINCSVKPVKIGVTFDIKHKHLNKSEWIKIFEKKIIKQFLIIFANLMVINI